MTTYIAHKIPGMSPPPSGISTLDDTFVAAMRQHADLSADAKLPRGPQRRAAVYRDLVAEAATSQASAVSQLQKLKQQGLVTGWESMYMPNALVVHATKGQDQAVADALRGMADIEAVTANHEFSVHPQGPRRPAPAHTAPTAGTSDVAWGVAQIGAPKAWAAGYTGAGVTIGIVDTGLDATHPAIAKHYRGYVAGGTRVDDYNWFDPIGHKTAPYDDDSHGTHVAGTSAGGVQGHEIGVAPGAKLIAAKGLNAQGYNTTVGTLAALQWMLAPTDSHGNNPKPELGADVINNSWGDADQNDAVFLETWQSLQAAGTEVVAAAGNDGPSGKVSPPGSYPVGTSVAATNSRDKVAYFSSRGPSKFAPKAVFPQVAAPGVSVESSVPGGGYEQMDGTSMASPHVVGAIALMLSAKPTATHEQIVKALEATATDIAEKGPDSSAGYGRINVDKAIQYLLSH